MRKHYYIEVFLLIFLSISAAILAADHNFYMLLDNIFIKIHLSKIHFSDTVIAYIRLVAFIGIILLSVANIFKYLHSEKKLVQWLLISLHNTFFHEVPDLKNSEKESIYRITCYKYYTFGWKLFTILIVLSGVLIFISTYYSLTSNHNSFWKFIIIFSTFVFSFFSTVCILMTADSWWYQAIKRLLSKDRKLKIGKNYLLGYVRYGFENGIQKKDATTFPFLIDNNINRLFAGKVFKSRGIDYALNNHNINHVLAELKIEKNLIESLKPFVNAPPKESYTFLDNNITPFGNLDKSKKDDIYEFMINTNTTAWDLFNINDRKHCNHFVGFKIMNNTYVWGVVVIDILNENLNKLGAPEKFLEILNKTTDAGWLDFNLRSFSDIFSKTINPSKK